MTYPHTSHTHSRHTTMSPSSLPPYGSDVLDSVLLADTNEARAYYQVAIAITEAQVKQRKYSMLPHYYSLSEPKSYGK